MNVPSIDPILRLDLLVAVLAYLGVIFWLLKKKRLTVRYSLIWLISGFVFLIFAVFPYVVLVLRDLFKMEMPVNVVFMLVLAFVLLLLLSISSIVSGQSEKIKRLTQSQALLEQRVRELEEQLRGKNDRP